MLYEYTSTSGCVCVWRGCFCYCPDNILFLTKKQKENSNQIFQNMTSAKFLMLALWCLLTIFHDLKNISKFPSFRHSKN